jgi:putative two-component system response regulator
MTRSDAGTAPEAGVPAPDPGAGPASAPEPSDISAARILLIDDESSNLRVLTRILARAGFRQVTAEASPVRGLTLFEELAPDLVLLDLHMSEMSGFDVLEQLRSRIPPQSYLPILVLTGDDTTVAKQRALTLGAKDFITKPFDTTEVVLRIRNLLETRSLHLLLADQNRLLEARVLDRTRELNEAQIEMLQRLAAAAEVRDDDTGQHTQRVGEVSGWLARAHGLSEARANLIRRAAPLHDVGKIGVPDEILRKPGRLTEAEYDLMKTHTLVGARILTNGHSELLHVAERIARSHHERWDGSGYPDGLAGEAIPLEARLVAVADFSDALSHDRPYRPALPLGKVLGMIRESSGHHFDPRLVEVFLSGLGGQGLPPPLSESR